MYNVREFRKKIKQGLDRADMGDSVVIKRGDSVYTLTLCKGVIDINIDVDEV